MLLLFALIPPGAEGEAWLNEIELRLAEGYDSNRLLTAGPHEGVFTTDIGAQWLTQRQTETSELRAALSVDLFYDTGEEGADLNDSEVLRVQARQRSELQRWGLDGRFVRDTTIRTTAAGSLSDAAVGAIEEDLPPDIDTALVDVEVRRQRANLRPFWSWDATERTDVGFEYRFATATHEGTTNLQDYQQHTIAPFVTYSLSEIDEMSVKLEASRYETTSGRERTADTYALTARFARGFSETFRGALEGGVFHTEFTGPRESGEESGFVLGISAVQQLEAGDLRLRVEHRLYPSGSGELVLTDQALVRYRRDITARLAFTIEGRALDVDALGTERANDRRYLELSPQISWNFSRRLQGAAWYRYRYQKREIEGESAESNGIFVGLRYLTNGGL